MNPVLQRYIGRAASDRWPLHGADDARVNCVVVVPALAEHDTLFHTLKDLTAGDEIALAKTAVIVVVNNRKTELAGAADVASNQATLAAIPQWKEDHPALRLAWIDASSPGCELDDREGVGLARKIGLDWGLRLLIASNQPEGALVCLDADTRVDARYLDAIRNYYRPGGRWAAVVDYAHPLDGADGAEGIQRYEIFLRYCELGLHYARSPYAYPAIGSTITCTATAYATAGGMKRSQAGEDFYFLEKLAKAGPIARIPGTTVSPSARLSHRVPFGTGRSMQAYAAGTDGLDALYNPGCYTILREWLQCMEAQGTSSPEHLLEEARKIHVQLAGFLDQQRFVEQFEKLQQNAPDPLQLRAQFHRWFDAFRTMKCIHHLRSTALPQWPLREAVDGLLSSLGAAAPEGVCSTEELLAHLRTVCRERSGASGVVVRKP